MIKTLTLILDDSGGLGWVAGGIDLDTEEGIKLSRSMLSVAQEGLADFLATIRAKQMLEAKETGAEGAEEEKDSE